ncbi:aminoacyl tRNA synthase complex-interacting multifunctional protein 2 isoform X2 [Chelonus insularis]|uniref:aminoacyl tRNA synthase complex-interacting multifunctional protein 2 isoform X2 n=1 Tax=Chelonus insularis TaxID=460826 RepID=UPI00158D300C|nr:aminoacyl tRNA synthase complex-interacting multifunctional protein 2 isoform X2 [Chelonus insularis]
MVKMYSLKPIIDQDITINRPICMYEMKNIHDDSDLKLKCRIVSETPSAEVTALEERQKKILVQLAELKNQVLTLCNVLNKNNNQKVQSVTPIIRYQIHSVPEIVLNVSRSKPCYSLLALGRLWTDIDFKISPFIHSTIKSEIPKGFENTRSNDKANSINIILIWKEVPNTELIISGVQKFPIIGESNFLRYLVRSINDGTYENPESIQETMKIDKILDLSNLLIHQSQENKQKTLDELNRSLKSNTWFSDHNEPGISDLAAWSAVKQSLVEKLPSNLVGWYKKCENLFLK